MVDPTAAQLARRRAVDAEAFRDALREPRASTANVVGVNLGPGPISRQLHEGEYIPPGRPNSNGTWKGLGAGALGLGLLFAKFKSVLFVLFSFKWFLLGGKIALTSLSFLASIWFYALFWGWKFAIVFVVMILIHELGHVALMRIYGIPASLPYFIPGMGAFINMKGRPASALAEAFVALAGPLAGTFAALMAYAIGEATGAKFWIAAAYTGFFLNLFNLAPVLPLDGGRIVGAISPRIWIFGLGAMIVAMVAFHWWNPLILILILFSIPQMIAAWQGKLDPAYHDLTMGQRGTVAFAYFGLAGFLLVAMLATQVSVPH